MSRKLLSLLLIALAWGAGPGSGQEPADQAEGNLRGRATNRSGQRLISPQTQDRIEDGLAWLAARQKEDGSFWSRGQYRREVAITALAGMAFMAAGNLPNRGPYGAEVTKAVEFILASARPDGLIYNSASASYGPMYGHGFSTLFLAEIYGTVPEDFFGAGPERDLRRILENAVQLIVVTQNEEGGWRYEPSSPDADISVTVCQVMALRAARNAGLVVPTATIDRAIRYVKRCQNNDGGFMYQLTTRGVSLFPRSAAGVVALQSAGIYEGEAIREGLAYLLRHLPRPRKIAYQRHYFYGHYYAVQAMWQAGGQTWVKWYPAIRDELLELQRDDGRWSDASVCDEFGTAMALIILQMPNGYLPIFQR